MNASGQWSNTNTGMRLTPDFALSGSDSYREQSPGVFEQILPVVVGVTVTIVASPFVTPMGAAALGGLAMGLSEGYLNGSAAGHSGWELAGDMAVGGAIGMASGVLGFGAGSLAGAAVRGMTSFVGLSCSSGMGAWRVCHAALVGAAIGTAEGAAFGVTQGFVHGGLTTGTLAGAYKEATNGLISGRGHRRPDGRDLPPGVLCRRHASGGGNRGELAAPNCVTVISRSTSKARARWRRAIFKAVAGC